MLHNIVIKQRRAYLYNNRFVQGGINSDTVSLFTDPEWEDCDTILITLKNSNVENPETYLIKPGEPLTIPKSMLSEAGFLYFSFTGYKGEEQRYTTEKMSFISSSVIAIKPKSERSLFPSRRTPSICGRLMSFE